MIATDTLRVVIGRYIAQNTCLNADMRYAEFNICNRMEFILNVKEILSIRKSKVQLQRSTKIEFH